MFRLQQEAIDCARLNRELSHEAAGALVSFEGRIRNTNEGRSVDFLEYEAYPGLAEREMARIIEEAGQRFPMLGLACVHRTGRLGIGDVAVWVGALSGHRGEAFEACQFVIDELKFRVPIWKKEHYSDGDAEWVNCARCEEHASHRHPSRKHTD